MSWVCAVGHRVTDARNTDADWPHNCALCEIERLHARGRVLEAELEQEARVSNLIINGLRLKTSELENELEQARAECEAIKLRSGELCEKCGWRSKFVGNQCLCCMANAENFP